MATRVLRRASLALLPIVVLVGVGTALATWVNQTTNPATSVTAATLEAPASLVATATVGCASVALTWTASSNAAAYVVDRSTNGGSTWTERTSLAGTSWVDTSGVPSGTTATWRVRGAFAAGTWRSTAATSLPISCVTGTTLAATNPPGSVALSWNATAGVSGYDIQRLQGGAWTYLATNRTGSTYTDTEAFTPGEAISYRVRPVTGGVRGDWSNDAAIAAWQPVGGGTTPPSPLKVTRAITNDWGAGYGADVTIQNLTAAPIVWQITLSIANYPYNGAVTGNNVTTVSNNGTSWVVKGVSYNNTVPANGTITFSYSGNRAATPPMLTDADVAVSITNDWGGGYCAKAVVTTTSPVPILWRANLAKAKTPPFAGTPNLYPPPTPSPSGGTTISYSATAWVVRGASYNEQIVEGQVREFTWCGNKS